MLLLLLYSALCFDPMWKMGAVQISFSSSRSSSRRRRIRRTRRRKGGRRSSRSRGISIVRRILRYFTFISKQIVYLFMIPYTANTASPVEFTEANSVTAGR